RRLPRRHRPEALVDVHPVGADRSSDYLFGRWRAIYRRFGRLGRNLPLGSGSRGGLGNTRNIIRGLVFKLGRKVSLPPVGPLWQHTPPIPPDTADAATLTTGFDLFSQFCLGCHGGRAVGGGVLPDLRKSSFLPVDAFYNIVLDGLLQSNGMADFGAGLDRSAGPAIPRYYLP